jgi:large subunit ribosomal protein L24
VAKYRIRKDDRVKVIAGKDKGKTGRVLHVDRVRGRVLIEGINLARKAMRKRRQEDRGGIAEIELPIHISNVMLVTRGGQRTRIGIKTEEGRRVRVARKTNETV